MAGRGMSKVQRDLTEIRERARFLKLDSDRRALTADDIRRVAWISLDCFRKTWVTS